MNASRGRIRSRRRIESPELGICTKDHNSVRSLLAVVVLSSGTVCVLEMVTSAFLWDMDQYGKEVSRVFNAG